MKYSGLELVRYVILIFGLTEISWSDFKKQRISNQSLIMLGIIRTLLLIAELIFFNKWQSTVILSAVFGGIVGGGAAFLCYIFSRGGIGAGDVKLNMITGYYLGADLVLQVDFWAVLFAGAYCVFGLLLKKASMKTKIPFTPFIVLGIWFTLWIQK